MANKNAARVLPFILMAVLSASNSSAQVTQSSGENADAANATSRARALQDSAPNAPSVTCKGDQLTILANNSTLESVLTAVHNCIGVQFDIPDGAMESRVFDQLGPGPARQVLTALLGATDFNFVIGSSDANPEKINSVLLMARVGDAPSATEIASEHNLTAARRAWLQSRQFGRGAPPAADEDNSSAAEPAAGANGDSSATSVDNPAATANQGTASTAATAAADTASTASENAATPAPDPNPSSTAPSAASPATEDRITSMQQLFDQRRQMIQNQNAPKPQ